MGKGRVRERGGYGRGGGCGRGEGVGRMRERVYASSRKEPFAIMFVAIKINDFVPENINCISFFGCQPPVVLLAKPVVGGEGAVANNLTLKGHVRASHFIRAQGGCPLFGC